MANNTEIERPEYYTLGKIECIDYIWDKQMNFFLGNVTKYVTRAGHKDGESALKDLKKARQYLDMYIQKLEGEQQDEYLSHITR